MTQLLGIVNVTPDSFSDGGLYLDPDKALHKAKALMDDGATWVDIGAESTKPGAAVVAPDQEWARLEAVIPRLLEVYPGAISLDTKNPTTAEKFLAQGGTIINDVSGAQNPAMRDIVAAHEATIIVNHFPGATTAEVHEQQIDSMNQVADELLTRAQQLVTAGVHPDKIILDPGIGFGKTMELNDQLLRFASFVRDYPVLIGHSKKRFLGEHRYEQEPNRAAAKRAIDTTCAWLRVHDPAWYRDLKGITTP